MKKSQRFFTVALPVVIASGCGSNQDTFLSPLPAVLTLMNVPTGCPTSESAADLYTTVVANTCAVANCHGQNGNAFLLQNPADLRAQWVNKPSKLYAAVAQPFVTPNDVNKSWIMYKLTGSQGPYGSKMPSAGALTSDQVCKFVAWINSGAN